MGLVTTTRRYMFQSTHKLGSLQEGKHGHHFYLEVMFQGAPVALADQCYKEKIESQVHGKDLSKVADPPTGEMLAQWIHKQLLLSPLGKHLLGVAVQETPKNRYISSMTEARFV